MNKYLTYQKIHFFLAALLLPIVLILTIDSQSVSASVNLQDRYDNMSSSAAGVKAIHTIGFTFGDLTDQVGSILIQFCQENPLPDQPCTLPSGMNVSGVDLTNSTGNTGYEMATNSSNSGVRTAGYDDLSDGWVLLTSTSGVPLTPSSTPNTYELSNITNPTSVGEYYVRVQTFAALDGTGPYIEFGGIAYDIITELSINTIVPPYLTFCAGVVVADLNCGSASGSEIDFGDMSPNSTSDATSQFLVATNATFGYSVTMSGSTMTSGNNIISSLSSPTASKIGSSQFGVNLVANSVPQVGSAVIGNGSGVIKSNYDQQNRYTFNDGDTIVTSVTSSDFNRFTASYLVNVNQSQPAGVYSTTINYICLANF